MSDAGSRLESLPPELLDHIVTFLPRKVPLILRLVSRQINHTCFDHFAHSFFRKKGFLITKESLHVLYAISQHHILRKYVQHVWFNPDCFTFVGETISRTAIDDGDPELIEHARKIDKYVREHHDLLHSEHLQNHLTTVFANLPMLKTVGMRRGDTHSPYGWRTMAKATGLDPRNLGSDYKLSASNLSDPTYLFVAMIKALATSQREVRRLYTDAIQVDFIEESKLPSEDELKRALKTVSYLEINAIGLPGRDDGDHSLESDYRWNHGCALEMVLKSTPELVELGMTIFKDPKQRFMIAPNPYRLATWAQTYPFQAFKSISENVRLGNLRRVKLEKLSTESDILCGFLRPCSSQLMSLKLRHMQLLDDSWHELFVFLHDECPSTEYLLLHDLTSNGQSLRFADHTATTDVIVRDTERHEHGTFTDFRNLNLELVGHKDIKDALDKLVGALTYESKLFSYEMDDSIWYTDTSDEDW